MLAPAPLVRFVRRTLRTPRPARAPGSGSLMLVGAALVGMLGAAPALAQDAWGKWDRAWHDGQDDRVAETREIAIPHLTGKTLSVETENGAIRIHKTDRKDIRITAVVRAESQERLDEIGVVIERASRELGSGLSIVADYGEKDERRRGDSVSLIIEIPDARGVTARATNGPVELKGLGGEADIRTTNGPVTVTDQSGVVRAHTTNGPVAVHGAVGLVDVRTANGTVKVTEATGDVAVSTSNSSITVEQAPGNSGVLSLRSSNGTIRVAVADSISGEMRVTTSNGKVVVDPALGAEVEQRRSQRAVIRFDDAEAEHVISTSNSNVTIEHAAG